MELISVIIPVYKVEPYLERCIKSVVEQTYKNLEIILVDDGSPDSCPEICDKWAKKDSRIKVIHKENGGLSDARNAGMLISTGEMIGFVDSDDWIEPNMYQLLYDNMVQNNCDISACGVQMDWEDMILSRLLTKEGRCVLNAEDAMRAIIEESWLKQPVVYKLYKASLVKDILFPIGKYHEDVFWSYQAIGRAKKVCVFETPCYHYLQRSESIMGEGYSLKRLDALEAKVNLVEFVNENYPQLSKLAKMNLHFSCMYTKQMLMRYCSKEIENIGTGTIKKVLKANKIKFSDVDMQSYNVKQIIWFFMSKISFFTTCRIRTILGIGF